MNVTAMIAKKNRCMRTTRNLQKFLDGALEPSEVSKVLAHLEECRRCGLDVEVYRQIKATLEITASGLDAAAIGRLREFATSLSLAQIDSED